MGRLWFTPVEVLPICTRFLVDFFLFAWVDCVTRRRRYPIYGTKENKNLLNGQDEKEMVLSREGRSVHLRSYSDACQRDVNVLKKEYWLGK